MQLLSDISGPDRAYSAAPAAVDWLMRALSLAAGLFAILVLVVSANASAAPTSAQFAEIEKASHIAEGSAQPKSTLYVFFDANCWYCNLTWKALQYYEKAGLQVRWIPVAYQKPSSTTKAAAIMEARDAAAALRENELKYRVENYDGGIVPLGKPRPETLKALEANLALMKKIGVPATPAVVWRDAKGVIGFRNAVPKLSELPAITGLPAQRIEDRDLQQFK